MRLKTWLPFLLVLSVPGWPAIVSIGNPFDQYGKVGNGTCADPNAGVCGAASMINSFEYLRQSNKDLFKDSSIIPDWDGDKSITQKDLETSRDKLGIDGWKSPSGDDRKGYYKRDGTVRSDWEAKVDWLNDFAPNKIVFHGQINANLESLKITEKDVSKWKMGDALENKWPEFDFLWKEIDHHEDIEIAFRGGNTFHAVTVTGVEKDDKSGDQFIRYLDSNDVKTEKKAKVSKGADGQLQFTYGADKVDILYAFAESPSPEPSAVILAFTGAAFILVRYRRRVALRRAKP